MDRAKGHVPRGRHSGAGDHQLPGQAAKGRDARAGDHGDGLVSHRAGFVRGESTGRCPQVGRAQSSTHH